MDFVHLHNHSDYSILDGAIKVDGLVKKAAEMNMPGIALTDHGNMFGAIEFYQKARSAGIKPIVGQEFYMAPGSRLDRDPSRDREEGNAYHLILLAENYTGYKNLMKLSSIGYVEGFYYKPRIDFEVFEKYSEGLICSSACLAGQIPSLILNGKEKEAKQLAGRFSEIMGPDHFYLELQYHGIPEQETVNRALVKMAADMDLPLIATNDSHYLNRDDAYSHEVLLCVQTGRTMSDQNRMRFQTDQFYLKSADEMSALFSDYPDSIFNTVKICDMVDLELDLGNPILPNFKVPEGFNLDSYLRHLVNEGARMLYGSSLPEKVSERIDFELSVITQMQFSGYFLIVWDFIKHARSVGIPVGPGRGSAAGSIVSYCLGITSLDPLKYDLLFERFLNPERNEMPDMDLDFCANRREEVIEYVRNKYGDDHVSQIITYNKMKSKAVIKDVARALDIPFARANEISKMIDDSDKTLHDTLKRSKEFKELYKEDEGKRLIDISLKLEGLVRSAGKHAAGVVISRGPLTDYVPLYKDPREGSVSSQYEKDTLEKAGLVKMDFLGLKNLSIIDKCLKLIQKNSGDSLDINSIPLDDAKTFDLLRRADTKGVFQLESSGMQNLLRRLGPTTFEEVIAIVALFRPGPLNSGMVDDFIKRKKEPGSVSYLHESLETILKDTLGVVVYQEQVMRISQIIAGFTMPEADRLRKAMGKKNIDIINQLEEKFLTGAEKNNIDRKLAEDLYSMIKKFGEYGFNKSHSAAYALVSYQTAYLKAHYLIEYMTALLSAQPDKQDDVIQYINDCKSCGIQVLPPSINNSDYDFTIEGNSIRFGLSAIKGIGEKAIDIIIRTRTEHGPFESVRDYLENVDSSAVNKGVLEALIKAGAFDCIYENRARLYNAIELIVETARRLQEDRASGQGSLFGEEEQATTDSANIDLPETEEWGETEKLQHEKEVLGLYISGHPLEKYEKEIRSFSSASLSELDEKYNGREVSIIGVINNLQMKRAQKSGNPYAVGMLEDIGGTVEVMFFSRLLGQHENLINSSQPVMITGTIEIEGNTPSKLIANGIKSLKEVRRESISALHIKLDPLGVDDDVLDTIMKVVTRYSGECPIFFHVKDSDGEKIIKAHSSFNISPSEGLVHELERIIGGESIRYSISSVNHH